MLKIGDIVRFLNDVGGGRVVGFRGKNMVMIEDEDGFEMPVPVTECVAVGNVDDRKKEAPVEEVQADRKMNFEAPIETRDGDLISLSLAYTQNKQSGENADFQVSAVNESNYSVFLNYLTKDEKGKYTSRFGGVVAPYSRERLFAFGNKFLNEVNRKFILRAVPFKTAKSFDLKPVYEVELNLDPVTLLKAGSFKENTKVDEPAYIMEVICENEVKYFNIEEQINSLNDRELKKVVAGREHDGKSIAPQARNHQRTDVNAIEEVDLHAAQILDTTAGMSSFDILSYQLKVFREHMDKYYGKVRGKRIVFIHGKGEGVLRQEILKELKKSYPKAKAQDASFREYGFGATMVFV